MSAALFFFMLFSRSDGTGLVLLAVTGAAAGLYLFIKGFRLLRFKRMILDTPLSRIHSASIGLLEVTGTPVGPYVLTAPVTGEPCYYYRVQAFQWVQSGNKHEWKSVLDESLCVPFFLEDSTGRVLVNPQGAQMDVHRSFSDEVGSSIFQTPGLCPPNVRDFLARRGLIPAEKIKIEERIIPQNFPLFVFGTFGENPASNSWSPRPHVGSPAAVSLNSLGGTSASFTFRTNLQAKMPSSTASALSNVLSRVPGVQVQTTKSQVPPGGAPFVLPNRAAAAMNPRDTPLPAALPPGSAKPTSNQSSSGSFDLHPSVAIGKGERNEPFAISGHSQREVVGKLAWKSAACIWGGPVLTLVCLYFLMVYFQWNF